MPVVIENNSSDPVDYDVSIGGGGGGNMMMMGGQAEGQGCASACRLRFYIPSQGSLTYEPSEDASSSHMFLINPGSSGETTFIELRNVLISKTETTVVTLEQESTGGGTFYRIQTG